MSDCFTKKFSKFKSYLISLVPKVKTPKELGDYRLIACCSFIYKIITTVLCNRIKIFLKILIFENQSAFMPGRLIAENNLLAHEQIRNFNQGGRNKLCIKIDLIRLLIKSIIILFYIC